MLTCNRLSVETPEGKTILSNVSAKFADQEMHAVIGPSGCGKTTLMKAILGMISRTGTAKFAGENIHSSNELAGKIGFVPQFTLAQQNLTVEETFRYALALSIADAGEQERRLKSVLQTTKLSEHADKRVGALSGGQLRRVGLGLELTLSPHYLVCDEVTSGLDPNSEDEMLDLMRDLVTHDRKSVICIIHNLAKLSRFDTITVVYRGHLIFQGTFHELQRYFGIENGLQLYRKLETLALEVWVQAWEKFSGSATKTISDTIGPQARGEKLFARTSFLRQVAILLSRRFCLFSRDIGYLALTLAITFGFPCIVVIFALDGLPQIQRIPLDQATTISMHVFENAIKVQMENSQIATLATGLLLFQVVLLALMGANNGGREIAAERNLYEKERMNGLRPSAYALSKIIFTSAIAIFQGAWMCGFVKIICQFPGSWLPQMLIMAAVCVGMTLICLGFSATLQSPEKASLLSIYLVGFQLPLSGIVLALPDALVWVFRPFINIFWGWSGFFDSMREAPIYDAYVTMTPNAAIFGFSTSMLVLFAHIVLGALIVFYGCVQKRSL